MAEESKLTLEDVIAKLREIPMGSWIYRRNRKEGKRSKQEGYQTLIEGTEYKFEMILNPTSVLPQYIIMTRIENSNKYMILFSSEQENYNSFQIMEELYKQLHEERVKRKV